MSRIGKKLIEVPKNVKLALDSGLVHVEGPKGKLQFKISPRIKAVFKDDHLSFDRVSNQKSDKALHGTTRSVINNMILGVTNGFSKELAIEGVVLRRRFREKV